MNMLMMNYRADDSLAYEDSLRDEYDFSELGSSVRGKYAETYRSVCNIVKLDDVFVTFPNKRAVDDALCMLTRVTRWQVTGWQVAVSEQYRARYA